METKDDFSFLNGDTEIGKKDQKLEWQISSVAPEPTWAWIRLELLIKALSS